MSSRPPTRLTRLGLALTVMAALLNHQGAAARPANVKTASLAAAGAKLVGEAGGQAGFRVQPAGDLDGDGFDDLVVGAWLADKNADVDKKTDEGAVYLVYGPVTSGFSLARAHAKLLGEAAGAFAGETLAGPADVDGDGYDDLLIGAPGPIPGQPGELRPGRTYIVYGGPDRLTGTRPLPEVAHAFLLGEMLADSASLGLHADDLDGDGTDDLVIGGAGWSGQTGKVWVVYGSKDRLAGEVALADIADAQFLGEHPSSATGFSLASDDLDGDGITDLVIGAQSWGTLRGAAYVVYGTAESRFSETRTLATAGVRLAGEEAGDIAGTSVATGDLDGDGTSDLVVGAPAGAPPANLTRAGTAYVFYGGRRLVLPATLAVADVALVGEGAGDRAGSVGVVGEPSGDGRLAVGAGNHDGGGSDAGAVYLTALTSKGQRLTGRISLATAARRKLVGEAPNDRAGRSPVGKLDANADGLPDLLIGAEGQDEGGADAGAAYLLFAEARPAK